MTDEEMQRAIVASYLKVTPEELKKRADLSGGDFSYIGAMRGEFVNRVNGVFHGESDNEKD